MKKKIQKTIHQHYVWRYYLKPWTTNKRIQCKMNGRTFPAGLMTIGQQKYFYKLHEIKQKHLDFLKQFLDTNKIKDKKQLKRENKFIKLFYKPFSILKLLNKIHFISNEKYDEILTDTEEHLYCKIENSGKKFLQQLNSQNISFFNNEKERITFLYFLAEQYFRTSKLKNEVLASASYYNDINTDDVWPIIRHVFADRLARNMYKRNNGIKLLINSTTKNFITCDQPVMNIADNKQLGLCLYYPISPKTAIVIEENTTNLLNTYEITNDTEIDFYNTKVKNNYEKQMYAIAQTDF